MDRRHRSHSVRALLSVGILFGFGTIGTAAYWTDDSAVTVGGFDSGEIHLDLFGADRLKPETHQWIDMTLAQMIPGSSRAAVVTVTNNSIGGVRLTYTVRGGATGAIAQHLLVTLRSGGASNGAACSGGTLVGAADTPLSNTDSVIGSTTVELGSEQSDALCVQVRLSPDVPTEMQGQESTATFVFVGTQAG